MRKDNVNSARPFSAVPFILMSAAFCLLILGLVVHWQRILFDDWVRETFGETLSADTGFLVVCILLSVLLFGTSALGLRSRRICSGVFHSLLRLGRAMLK